MVFYLLSFFINLLFTQAKISLWNKHYITYSVENDIHNTKIINDGIKEWDIHSLELKHVNPGQGDIKFYFKNLSLNVLGVSEGPGKGIITITKNESSINVTKIIQHEFGHALGLQHSKNENSLMFWAYASYQQILESDRQKLNELYKCRYDSVTLLNAYTYLKFKGSFYERIDLNTEDTTQDKIWHPNITKVTSMYRNNSHYIIVSNHKYFEFNNNMQFQEEGSMLEKIPNISYNILAILTLKNGTIICFFENKYILYKNAVVKYQNLFKIFPEGAIQGAYSDYMYIYLISKDYLFKYDENFNFINQSRLCDHSKLKKIHCCNTYSNV